jgi:hypothetical protein
VCNQKNTSWAGAETTYCNSTLSIRFSDGWHYSPDWNNKLELLEQRADDIYFYYEDSGLGSQFFINWGFLSIAAPLPFLLGASLLIHAATVSAGSDSTERQGIVISIDSAGGQLVAVDPVPISVNYRRVPSSLEAAIIDPRKTEAPSNRSLKKLLEDVPIGTVFLNVKNKDGGPSGYYPAA